jgi:phosphoglucomutase
LAEITSLGIFFNDQRKRYDYEEVDGKGAGEMMDQLRKMVGDQKAKTVGATYNGYKVADCDDFAYTDPIDGSISKKQVSSFLSNARVFASFSQMGLASFSVSVEQVLKVQQFVCTLKSTRIRNCILILKLRSRT